MALFYLSNMPHAKSKYGEHIATENHFDYIVREGKYGHISGRDEDLVYKESGNMPEWANKPRDFWKAAEDHRRKNGRAYREIKVALQEELSLEDNIELIENFLKETGISKNHAYTFAIHDKTAAFDPDHRNIHAHIMFCEKTIERYRPLKPEQYFCQFRGDRRGEPMMGSGYYADPYYKTKEFTKDARRLWAELVNEKFKERGINKIISEKTLKAQADELRKEGKEEEAKYFDRKPAPHMGKVYRNKKNLQRIHELMDMMDKDANQDVSILNKDALYQDLIDGKDEEQWMEMSAAERRMILFAADALARRVARELQEERLKKLEKEREAKAVNDENKEFLVVTTSDLYDAFLDKENQSMALQDKLHLEMTAMQKKILPDNVLYELSKEELMPGYKVVKRNYQKSQADVLAKKAVLEKQIKVFGRHLETDVAEYQKLTHEHNELQVQMKRYETVLNQKKESLQVIFNDKKIERDKCKQKFNSAYRRKIFAEKQASMYHAQAVWIAHNFPRDRIVYSDAIPRIVEKWMKVNGIEPLYKKEQVVYKGSTYFICGAILPKANEPGVYTADAIRYGNSVIDGKVKSSTLTLKYEQVIDKQGKMHTVLTPLGVSAGDKTINLYKENNRSTPIDQAGITNSRAKWVGHTSQNRDVLENVTTQLVEANKTSMNGRLIDWNELQQKRKRDEYERTEEELERFSDEMHLGNGR